ncbi:hypothetical protein BKA65DRAFT_11820 [Rhexocercosporidium sp. MPI-PUGE-AT-0058]|nr:hypothetical protein BKA65DRAFT_11820 [Rhexocercosporidium sp. MPI-PUGE-AT-0058]
MDKGKQRGCTEDWNGEDDLPTLSTLSVSNYPMYRQAQSSEDMKISYSTGDSAPRFVADDEQTFGSSRHDSSLVEEAESSLSTFTSYATPSHHSITKLPPIQENFICLVPQCPSKPFIRRADLMQHTKHVHERPVDQHLRQNRSCSSVRDGVCFTRKDHFRDHLRDYYHEDIGASEGAKNPKTKSETKKWQAEQKKWLSSRRNNTRW